MKTTTPYFDGFHMQTLGRKRLSEERKMARELAALRQKSFAQLAAVVWLAGVYLLFWTTAPSELGPPLFGPVIMAFLTALAPAMLVSWLMHRKKQDPVANNQVEDIVDILHPTFKAGR